ncbi:hypothetical protein SAMN05421692_0120 [Chryseobacterium indologenes]|uniref:Uncharacterized protein n=1 Tax=Chryseobacterium oranimense TaxID=421058 RepID=A0A1M5KXI9_9FLAO|nr:hypothetical protein SAMN05421692_0120 [Chryseobacterium indologenes]SHG57467.1 hypothetical protein SAMN05421866_0874 [Chryseobacterium oranimense]SUX50665.1 Uncharacterised protein [Chryseobacterium indologenes]
MIKAVSFIFLSLKLNDDDFRKRLFADNGLSKENT